MLSGTGYYVISTSSTPEFWTMDPSTGFRTERAPAKESLGLRLAECHNEREPGFEASTEPDQYGEK